jgi:hypothetical protein
VDGMNTKPHSNPKLLGNPQYEAIRANLNSLQAQIAGLGSQVFAGKETPLQNAQDIAKEILPDLKALVQEASAIIPSDTPSPKVDGAIG